MLYNKKIILNQTAIVSMYDMAYGAMFFFFFYILIITYLQAFPKAILPDTFYIGTTIKVKLSGELHRGLF